MVTSDPLGQTQRTTTRPKARLSIRTTHTTTPVVPQAGLPTLSPPVSSPSPWVPMVAAPFEFPLHSVVFMA